MILWNVHNLIVNDLKNKKSLTIREQKHCTSINSMFVLALAEEQGDLKVLQLKAMNDLIKIVEGVGVIDRDSILKEMVFRAPGILKMIVINIEKSLCLETVKLSSKLISKFSSMYDSVTDKLLQEGLLDAYATIF